MGLEVVHIPQDEFPPGLPMFFTLPITSKRFNLVGYISVLLDKILHVQGRHLARRWPGRQGNFLSAKRLSEVVLFFFCFFRLPCFKQCHTAVEMEATTDLKRSPTETYNLDCWGESVELK